MGLRKGWSQRRIREKCMGWCFDRWYLKSPAGNFYELFRNDPFGAKYIADATIYLVTDKKYQDESKDEQIPPTPMKRYIENFGWENLKWNQVLQEIYKIEENGTYSKELSDKIEQCPECKELFNQSETVVGINTY